MNAIPALLDHLVLATPDLAATVADFTRRTGVAPAPGGVHVGLGTRNYLVSLGGSRYLEIIGPDPEQSAPGEPRPFDVDGLTVPRTVTWAISPPDLDAAIAAARARGYDPGPAQSMSRRKPDGTLLQWRLTDGDDAHPSGLVPFLIDWSATVHPTASGLPTTPLLSLAASAPEPDEIRPLLAALGTDLDLTTGPVGISFTVDTPLGAVAFG
ncbi:MULTISPECIES: VOC family protein [Streptomyces]|uniref:VOC family protein n=1 Tax=Streptomyces TaxID=1883 RepID=UPI00089B6ABD|nr:MULTISPECIES: VOC family protein [unclassified Streptomyces]SEB98101.1 Glyoxalase-like domain-containing protein [Streptomyces sp. KS_5]SED39217.1 Glyoxalase-like domain-containing protein [Streptomyces sp. PAN_FS17]